MSRSHLIPAAGRELLASPIALSAAVLAVSLATIASAWGFQLIGGLPPCPLCLQQRWAYYAAIPLTGAALYWLSGSRNIPAARAVLLLSALAMLAGAVLAAYHSGIEWRWWEGPTTCTGDLLAGTGGVLPDLDNAMVIRCDEAPWRLFGLSLAGYNVLISLALAVLAMMARQAARRGG